MQSDLQKLKIFDLTDLERGRKNWEREVNYRVRGIWDCSCTLLCSWGGVMPSKTGTFRFVQDVLYIGTSQCTNIGHRTVQTAVCTVRCPGWPTKLAYIIIEISTNILPNIYVTSDKNSLRQKWEPIWHIPPNSEINVPNDYSAMRHS